MNYDRLQKFSKEKLIEFILYKDERIEQLENRVKNLKYIGRLYIDCKPYSFYIKKDD